MKAKYLFYSLALASAFTACTQEELVNNPVADNDDLAKRAVVGNVIFEGDEIESRYNVENATFQKGDKMGLYLMDTYNSPAGEAYPDYQSHWWLMYNMSNHLSTNFSYVYEGNDTWVNPSSQQLSEGNYIAMFPQNPDIKNRQSLWHPINGNVQLAKHSTKNRYYVNRENQFFVAYEQISRNQETAGDGGSLKAKISMKPILTYGKMWFVNGSNEEIKIKKVVFRHPNNKALPNIAYVEPAGIVKNEADAKAGLKKDWNFATTDKRIKSPELQAPLWAWNDLASMEQYDGYTDRNCNTVINAQGIYNRSMFTQADARSMVRYAKNGNVYEYVFNFPGEGVTLSKAGNSDELVKCGISIALPAFKNWEGCDWNGMDVLVFGEKKNLVTGNWEYGYISKVNGQTGSVNGNFNLSSLPLWNGESELPEVTLDIYSNYFIKQSVIEVSTASDFYNLVKGRLDETNNSGVGVDLHVMAKGTSLKVNKDVVDLIKAYNAKQSKKAVITFHGTTNEENNSDIILNAENSIHLFNYADDVNVTLNASQEVSETIDNIGELTVGGDATLTVAKGTLENVVNNGTVVVTYTNVLGQPVSGKIETLTNNGIATLKDRAIVNDLTNTKYGQLYVTAAGGNNIAKITNKLINQADVYCGDCTDGYMSVSGNLNVDVVENSAKFDVTGRLEVTTLTNKNDHQTSEDGWVKAGILNNTGTIVATSATNAGTFNNGSATVAKGAFIGTLNNEAVVNVYGGDISTLTNTETGDLNVYSATACVSTKSSNGEIYYHDIINQEIGSEGSGDKHIYVANQLLTTTALKKVLEVTNVNTLWLKNNWNHDVALGDALRNELKEIRVGVDNSIVESYTIAATGKIKELILPDAIVKVLYEDILKVRDALALTVADHTGSIHVGAGSSLTDGNGKVEKHEQVNVYNATELKAALEAGKDVMLSADVTLTEAVTVKGEVTINLAGKTIATGNTQLGLTIDGGFVTIEGDGSITSNNQNMIYVKNSGSVEILGGTYDGTLCTNLSGRLTIKGGYFMNSILDSTGFASPQYTCLNEVDTNRGTISVMGGTFLNFNPAYNLSEAPYGDFVVNGYKVTVKNLISGGDETETKVNGTLINEQPYNTTWQAAREYTVVAE